jgi:anti-sigma factor RsiW
MISLLSLPAPSEFRAHDRRTIKVLEIAAHRAAMGMVDEIEKSLPAHLSHIAPAIAVLALTSATGRILASADNFAAADRAANNMTRILRTEVLHWRMVRLLH